MIRISDRCPTMPAGNRAQAISLRLVPSCFPSRPSKAASCWLDRFPTSCLATCRSACSIAAATRRSITVSPGAAMRRRRNSSIKVRATTMPLVVASAIGVSQACISA